MGIEVVLPPELDEFARSCVETGRFGSVDEVVRSALSLLKQHEEQRAALVASLEAATTEAQEVGYRTIEEVRTTVLAAIAEVERRRP